MAAKIARPKSGGHLRLTDEHRTKIQKSKILNRLIAHAEGSEDMTQTQVTAGLGLLKKALPDLSAVVLTGPDEGPIQTLNKIELVAKKHAKPKG